MKRLSLFHLLPVILFMSQLPAQTNGHKPLSSAELNQVLDRVAVTLPKWDTIKRINPSDDPNLEYQQGKLLESYKELGQLDLFNAQALLFGLRHNTGTPVSIELSLRDALTELRETIGDITDFKCSKAVGPEFPTDTVELLQLEQALAEDVTAKLEALERAGCGNGSRLP